MTDDDRPTALFNQNGETNVTIGPGEITEMLRQSRSGDDRARERLFDLVLPELERLASRYLRREKVGHTLQTGDLVNEVCQRLDVTKIDFKNRAHFKARVALMMRHFLIDYARSKAGRGHRVDVFESDHPTRVNVVEIIAIEEAVASLEKVDCRSARVVEMKFYGGLTIEEIAEELNVSSKTVKNDWKFARAFMKSRLDGDAPARKA